MSWIKRCVLVLCLAWTLPGWAETAKAPDPEIVAAQAATQKLNAYVELLNRTLRLSESLARYESWVNMKVGPTGRESIVYGVYSLYDVRREIAAAKAAIPMNPLMPELDAALPAYIAAYEALAPTITKADGYYERQDYKADKMAEGKELHAKLAPAAAAYLAQREKIDALFANEKAKNDASQLALIEKKEGRKARWHLTNVMTRAREIMALMPAEKKPVVVMAPFDEALSRFATAVRDLDEYAAAEPGKLSFFESRPRSFLGKLREFRDKLAKAKGDARRGAGRDVTWIVSDYNTLISLASIDPDR